MAPYSEWRRLKSCIKQWPGCEDGTYNPACCRFPKVCSCLADPDDFAFPDAVLEADPRHH